MSLSRVVNCSIIFKKYFVRIIISSTSSRYLPKFSTHVSKCRTVHASSVRRICTTAINRDDVKRKVKIEENPEDNISEKRHTENVTKYEKVNSAEKDPAKLPSNSVVASPVKKKKTLVQWVVAGLRHYYHGFRLLYVDTKICARLMWNVLNGRSLTRRERRQLVRTTSDLFRLVPFLVFVIVPFMEFLLPVAVKLFPSMLPSTFKEEDKEKEKIRKKFKGQLQMAKFLQDTIEETALQRRKGDGRSKYLEFVDFMARIRKSGEITSNQEILKYSKLFEDEITLDNLDHGQLSALCLMLGLNTVGTNNLLRFQLRMKLRQLAADDKLIKEEGIDTLAIWELQEACRARGMRAHGVPEFRLRHQLSEWLDLHLCQKIPSSLLLLSRALFLQENLSTEEQLKATISSLPRTTANEARAKLSKESGDRVSNRAKLDLIEQEEKALKKQKKEDEKEENLRKEAKKLKAAKATAAPVQKTKVEPLPGIVMPPLEDWHRVEEGKDDHISKED